MDPITIGVAVGTGIVVNITKKLLENATDPEIVAKSINWVFRAVDNFLKIRRLEKPKESVIAPPPAAPAPAADAAQAKVKEAEVEIKSAAAKDVIEAPFQETFMGDGIKMKDLDDFALKQIGAEVESLLTQLDIYLGNLRFEQEKASLYGGEQLVPIFLKNTIRIQQVEIARRVYRLNACMQKAYGVSAPMIDSLIDITSAG